MPEYVDPETGEVTERPSAPALNYGEALMAMLRDPNITAEKMQIVVGAQRENLENEAKEAYQLHFAAFTAELPAVEREHILKHQLAGVGLADGGLARDVEPDALPAFSHESAGPPAQAAEEVYAERLFHANRSGVSKLGCCRAQSSSGRVEAYRVTLVPSKLCAPASAQSRIRRRVLTRPTW